MTCQSCGADVPDGANYCTRCGVPVGGGSAGAAPRRSGGGASAVGSVVADRAPWIIAAVSVVVVVALVLVFLPRGPERPAQPAGGADAPFAGSGAGDGTGAAGGMGLSADMRTNADRLFNRIMAAAGQGDQAEVARFTPMAIQAYGMVDDLNADGIYHLALLHFAAGSNERALRTAGRILADHPDHLLALAVSAEASAAAGDSAAAAGYWRRLLDAYAAESARPLPEYVDHQPMLPTYRDRASQALGDG